MAIKDQVVVQVSGTVGRSFQTAKGGGFEVEVQGSGQYPDRWSCLGEFRDGSGNGLSVSQGDKVTVRGEAAVFQSSYEDTRTGEQKQALRRRVYRPVVVEHEAHATAVPDDSVPF